MKTNPIAEFAGHPSALIKMHHAVMIAFLIVTCAACISKNERKDYTITVRLTGVKDSTKFTLLNIRTSSFIDSAYAKNETFTFKGEAAEPFKARIHGPENYVIVWVENRDISIEGSYNDFFYANIKGSDLNTVMEKYRDIQRPLMNARDSLTKSMIAVMSENTDEANAAFSDLRKRIQDIDKKILDIRLRAIVDEPPSRFTLNELNFLKYDLSRDTVKSLYARFPDVLKDTESGPIIRTYFENAALNIGDPAMDVEGEDKAGNTIRLSQLKGKTVLLEFWASWCGPCRWENKHLHELYKAYRSHNFEVLSLSIDENLKAWKRVSAMDSISWLNVIDKDGSQSRAAVLYNVRGLPANVLIDSAGVIVALNVRGNALDEAVAKFTRRSQAEKSFNSLP